MSGRAGGCAKAENLPPQQASTTEAQLYSLKIFQKLRTPDHRLRLLRLPETTELQSYVLEPHTIRDEYL